MSGDLHVQNVTAGYGEGAVLEDVSISAESGTVTALIGRNGVGKTTTLRTIMGMLDASSGTITFDGDDVTDLPTAERYRRRMGMVPEDRGIFPDLTVKENLLVPKTHVDSEAWLLDEMFDFFPKLYELQDSKGKNLSGGEQQMLALARAIRPNPRILLLDEPTEGLAPQIVEDVRDVIVELEERSTTILLVEQNVELTLQVASYNYIMESGRIVFEGTSPEIRENGEIDRHLSVGASQD